MALINKGDIFLVNFDPTIGAEIKKTRPAVIVSNDINNANSPVISIAPVTSNVSRIYSFEVQISENIGGLKKKSKIMINQTRAVDQVRLIKKIGALPNDIVKQINSALILHYDLD